MDLFKKKTSGNVAKDRLKLVLVSDRAILAILLVILAIDLVVEGSKALAAQAKAKKAA